MDDKDRNLIMSLLKVCIIILVVFSPFITNDTKRMLEFNSTYIFIISILISSIILINVLEKLRSILIFISFLSLIYLYVYQDKIFILLFTIVILDLLEIFNINPLYNLLELTFIHLIGSYSLLFTFNVLFLTVIYYFNYKVVKTQSDYLNRILMEQQKLKNRLVSQEKKHGVEIMQSALKYENIRLEEMSNLSQSLHDKIGHSISGSVFKLEGAKLIVSKDSEKSSRMLDEVINALRNSVDEIRALLRREKPDNGELNINKLQMLFSDYSKKYEIETSFEFDGDLDKLSLNIWNVLLDNTIEALTNSLKYSQCSKIHGKLIIFNKIIRYQIKDNGIGTENIIKGMGLDGIENRIYTNKGSVSFSGKNGFEINMLLPVEGGFNAEN